MAKIDLNDYLEKLTEPEDRETVANRAYQRELFEQYVTKDGNFPEQRAQLLEDFRAGKELTRAEGTAPGSSEPSILNTSGGPISRTTSSARRPSSTASWTGYGGRAC